MDYKKIQIVFFLALLLGTLGVAIWFFMPYVFAIVFALTLAIVFQPLFNKLVKFFKGRRGLASLSTVVVVLVVIVLPLVFVGSEMYQQSLKAYDVLSDPTARVSVLNKVQEVINKTLPTMHIDIITNSTKIANWVVDFVRKSFGPIITNTLDLLFSFFLTIFSLYYVLKEGPKLKKALITFSPLSDKYDRQIINKLHTAVNSVIKGSLLVAFIQAAIAGIGFWIFGVPSPIFLGAVTFIAALIPAIGTVITVFPAVVYVFFTSSPLMALGLLLWGGLLVGLVDNIIRPKLLEKDINIHPLLIFLAVIGGITQLGPMGILLGPLVLSLLFALLDIYKQEFREYLSP